MKKISSKLLKLENYEGNMNQNYIKEPIRVFGYCRTSNVDDIPEKSIDEQIKIINAYAKNKNWAINHFFIDERRAIPRLRGLHRVIHPSEFQRMFDECKENDVVITASIDRIFGEVREAKILITRLKNLNVQLSIADIDENLTTNGSYLFLSKLLDAFIQRDLLSARRRHVHRQMEESFRFRGGVNAIGFSVEVKEDKKYLKVNEKEKKILEFIKEQRKLRNEELIKTDRKQSENYSLEKIYQSLYQTFDMEDIDKEITNSEGKVMRLKRFSRATLHRLLSDNPNNVDARLEQIKKHQDNQDNK
jgi:DNA invertase Pin-like site-specific DNA recombinase